MFRKIIYKIIIRIKHGLKLLAFFIYKKIIYFMDYLKIDLRNFRLRHGTVNDPKFNCSDLRGSDFSNSDIKKQLV